MQSGDSDAVWLMQVEKKKKNYLLSIQCDTFLIRLQLLEFKPSLHILVLFMFSVLSESGST